MVARKWSVWVAKYIREGEGYFGEEIIQLSRDNNLAGKP